MPSMLHMRVGVGDAPQEEGIPCLFNVLRQLLTIPVSQPRWRAYL